MFMFSLYWFQASGKIVLVGASTNSAAAHIGGSTVHHIFGWKGDARNYTIRLHSKDDRHNRASTTPMC